MRLIGQGCDRFCSIWFVSCSRKPATCSDRRAGIDLNQFVLIQVRAYTVVRGIPKNATGVHWDHDRSVIYLIYYCLKIQFKYLPLYFMCTAIVPHGQQESPSMRHTTISKRCDKLWQLKNCRAATLGYAQPHVRREGSRKFPTITTLHEWNLIAKIYFFLFCDAPLSHNSDICQAHDMCDDSSHHYEIRNDVYVKLRY